VALRELCATIISNQFTNKKKDIIMAKVTETRVVPTYMIELSEVEAQGLRDLLGVGVVCNAMRDLGLDDLYQALNKHKNLHAKRHEFLQTACLREPIHK